MNFNITDNVVMRGLGKMADFVILNILWIVCSIPIFTIGASTTAMYTVMLKIVKNEEGYIVRPFLKAFKENFKQSTVMWLILLLGGVIITADMIVSRGMQGTLRVVMQTFFLLAGIILVSISIYAFSLQARFVNTVKHTLKNAAILTIAKFPYTLLMLVITVGPVVLTLLTAQTLVIGSMAWMFIGVSLVCWLNSMLLRRIFTVLEEQSE